jgi:predicted transcriptional regulator
MPKLIKPERISLSSHPVIKEKWIQDQIAEDPRILGLGDIILKDKERSQPRAGRLDLLFQDADSNRRYEVELQLGKTDETHIIRTIEYWDIERKRYPQYDHCAVIIAEDITSRFLNIVSLFNGFIPIIALQMSAFKFGEDIALLFTKVVDELQLGLVEEDEEIKEPTNREYWIKRGSQETVKMADEVLAIIKEFVTDQVEFKYNKFYIGLSNDGQPFNFMLCRPRNKALIIEFKSPYSEEIQKIIEDEGLDDIGYAKRYNNYRIRLTKQDIKSKHDVLKDLLQKAYEYYK